MFIMNSSYYSFYSNRQNLSAFVNHTVNAEYSRLTPLFIQLLYEGLQWYQSNSCAAASCIFADGAEEQRESNESRLTQLSVQLWCGRLLHFTGHGPGDATLAAPLAVGGASTLKRHGGFFVLCIFSRSVIPVLKYHNSWLYQHNTNGWWTLSTSFDTEF